MNNDVERFINLIYMTDFMHDLFTKNNKQYLECIELTQDWNKFKNIYEVVELNNNHINSAIKEVILNKTFLKILKEEMNLDIDKIQRILKQRE